MKWLYLLGRLSNIVRRYRELNPVRRSVALYAIVFITISWANYSFVRFRIPLYEHSAFLPQTGVFLLYLWILLLLDELLCLFQSSSALATVVKKVKLASLALVALYAVEGLLLAINGSGAQSLTRKLVKVIAVSNPYQGSWNHGAILVEGWDGGDGRREILLASRRERNLYAGEDVEVVLQKGALFLNRVVEVREDLEKYYKKMLLAAPDSLAAIEGLVYVHLNRGNYDEAQQWYARLAEYGGYEEVGTELAQQMILDRHFGRAANLLKELINEDRSYENLYTLGFALAWAGQKQESVVYLREATELDPADYRAFYSLGYVYRDTHQYAEAKEAWETVLTLIPHFPEVEKNLKSIGEF